MTPLAFPTSELPVRPLSLGNLFIAAGEPEVNNGCSTSPACWHSLLARLEETL